MRALRATLLAVAARTDRRTLLIVSADSTVSSGRVSAELGIALAASGRRVLLVAADIRSSVLPRIFDIREPAGLGDLLIKGGDAQALTRQPKLGGGIALPGPIASRLAVLPTGLQSAQVLSALDSPAMTSLLQEQREAYDFVVLDSPPANVMSDLLALATQVDGVIVVGRAGHTRGKVVADLRRRLDQVGAPVLGGVYLAKGSRGRRRAGTPQPRQASLRQVSAGPSSSGSTSSDDKSPALPVVEAKPVGGSGTEAAGSGRSGEAGARAWPADATRPMPRIGNDSSRPDSGNLAKRRS
jgi:Mrp family chromosome partitioning ATPase